MYPSPERQWRCSETTVSLRHVVLETTGVVWAVCECFPSIFWSSDRFLQCPTCGYDVQMPSKLKLNQDIWPSSCGGDLGRIFGQPRQEMCQLPTQGSEINRKPPRQHLWSLASRPWRYGVLRAPPLPLRGRIRPGTILVYGICTLNKNTTIWKFLDRCWAHFFLRIWRYYF